LHGGFGDMPYVFRQNITSAMVAAP
jgi:hypothetical protein